MAIFFEVFRMVFHNQLLRCLSEIPQEPLTDFPAFHNLTSLYRVKWKRVISSSLLRFFSAFGSPVLRPHFSAIHVQHSQSALSRFVARTDLTKKFSGKFLKMIIQCCCVKLIT